MTLSDSSSERRGLGRNERLFSEGGGVCERVCAPVNATWDFGTGEDDFVHLYGLLRGGELVSVDGEDKVREVLEEGRGRVSDLWSGLQTAEGMCACWKRRPCNTIPGDGAGPVMW